MVSVDTFVDPAPAGFIEFESEQSKVGFFRNLRQANKEINGLEVWFTNDRTFDERAREKCLGLLKHNLIEIKGHAVHTVKINWKLGLVKVKGKKVASVSDEAEVDYSPQVSDIKDAVDEGLAAWYAKRQ